MPESLDFEAMARGILARAAADGIYLTDTIRDNVTRDIAEQLRLIWNTRGVEDLAKIEHELATMLDGRAAGTIVKHLDRALKALDR
jgi:hypothetical protein